jgi:putative SOS response-associated peptidase YedK
MCFTVAIMRNGVLLTAEEYYNSLPPNIKKKKENPAMPKIPDLFMISGFEHPALPVINVNGFELNNWGLIPNNGYVKNTLEADEYRKYTLNAKAETIFEKPSFKDNIISHRCLLPVSGFYEWREYENRKYPYYIEPKDASGFLLGSVYDSWTDTGTGEIRNTFSIITTPANPLMEMIHNVKKRMPLIMGIEDAQSWLQPGLSQEEIKSLMKPYDENRMKAHTISRTASNAKEFRNFPEIMNPFIYPELTQQTLF